MAEFIYYAVRRASIRVSLSFSLSQIFFNALLSSIKTVSWVTNIFPPYCGCLVFENIIERDFIAFQWKIFRFHSNFYTILVLHFSVFFIFIFIFYFSFFMPIFIHFDV